MFSAVSDLKTWIILAAQSSAQGALELLPWFALLVFVGNGLGSKALASLSLAEAWGYWWLIVTWGGTRATVSTLVSQSHGAGQHRTSRGWLVMSILSMSILNGIAAVAWAGTVPILTFLGFDADLVRDGASFLVAAIPVLFLCGVFVPISAYLSAVQVAWLPPLLDASSCILDIGLSFIFILGIGQVGGFGLPGAAWAWNLASAISAAEYLIALCWVWGREGSFTIGGEAPGSPNDGEQCVLLDGECAGGGVDDAEAALPLLRIDPGGGGGGGNAADGPIGDGCDVQFALSFAISPRCWRLFLAQVRRGEKGDGAGQGREAGGR